MGWCTYHDGERGGVHDGAEDDAEDAYDHGALLMGVGADEHTGHHGSHERRLDGEHAEHLPLHAQHRHMAWVRGMQEDLLYRN